MLLVANHRACALRRQVVLADVYAVEIGSNADVGAIVHDQGHAIAQRTANLARVAQHLARGAHLVSILQQGHASGGEVACIVHDGSGGAQRRREAGHVEDGVKLGQSKLLRHGVELLRSLFRWRQEALHELGIKVARAEVGIGHDPAVQRNAGEDALDHEHLQRARHARDGFGAVTPAHHQLGNQRIVVGRDDALGIGRRIHAHAGSAREC